MVHQFPPEFRGGTEACVQSLAHAQAAAGLHPVIVCGSDERHPQGLVRRETVGGLSVHRVLRRPGENYSMDHRQARVAEQVVALIDDLAPDVVHLHHVLNLSGDLGARLASAGHAVTATLHDFTTVCARFFLARPDGDSCREHFPLPSARCVECVLPDFPAGREALEVETRARAATAAAEAAACGAVIVPSRFVSAAWERSGLFERQRRSGCWHVLPHPVTTPDVPPRPRDRGDGRLVLATWGHLAPAKGVGDLIEALRLAADPRLALIVLGAPTDPGHGQALRAAAAGLPVEFRGAYAAGDVAALRGAADLAVFPSRAHETFGLVVAEARGLGFPVLASDRGALGELLGLGGEVVPAGDPAALAARLVALVDDPETLAAWAAAPAGSLLDPDEHASRVSAVYAQSRSR